MSFLISLQRKELYELEQLYETITGSMETAASLADSTTAREGLLHSLEKLREGLCVRSGDGCSENGKEWTTLDKHRIKCLLKVQYL